MTFCKCNHPRDQHEAGIGIPRYPTNCTRCACIEFTGQDASDFDARALSEGSTVTWVVEFVIEGGQLDGLHSFHEVAEDLQGIMKLAQERRALEIHAIQVDRGSLAKALYEAAVEAKR